MYEYLVLTETIKLCLIFFAAGIIVGAAICALGDKEFKLIFGRRPYRHIPDDTGVSYE